MLGKIELSKEREKGWQVKRACRRACRAKSSRTASAAQMEKLRTAGMVEKPPSAKATTSAGTRIGITLPQRSNSMEECSCILAAMV